MSIGFIFTVKTYSPLHAGIGQSIGKVDLPIEREKHTEYPCVYATGLKGSLRSFCEKHTNESIKGHANRIFGKKVEETSTGEVVFTDLKILLFPVRSSDGSFKYVTSEDVINRFNRDYEIVNKNKPFVGQIGSSAIAKEENEIFDYDKHIILEDFVFKNNNKNGNQDQTNIFGIKLTDVYIVDEKAFKYFVTNATQIIARNKLDDKKKTSENLWYEEALPAESILYSFLIPSVTYDKNVNVLNTLKEIINNEIVQIGGNETVGYGISKIEILKGGEDEDTKSGN